MTMISQLAMKLGVATLALALVGGAASAQQKAPAPAAPKAAPAPAAKAPADTKKKKGASACRGLAEAACGSNATCAWVKETTTKAGKKRRAHCRLKTAPPKKAAAPAKAPAKAAPAPAAKK